MRDSADANAVAVLVTGDPIPRVQTARGSWAQLIRETAGAAWSGPWCEVDLRTTTELPALRDLSAIVITGSPASITEQTSWMRRGEDHVRRAVGDGVPTFGICFGHQMMATALGGRVVPNELGRQIGTVDVEVHAADFVIAGLGPEPRANTTHVDVVVELPPGAHAVARTPRDPHAAVRFGERAWGVQFHPEIDADVMQRYVEARWDLIEAEGTDPDAVRSGIDDGVAGAETLRRFLRVLR